MLEDIVYISSLSILIALIYFIDWGTANLTSQGLASSQFFVCNSEFIGYRLKISTDCPEFQKQPIISKALQKLQCFDKFENVMVGFNSV